MSIAFGVRRRVLASSAARALSTGSRPPPVQRDARLLGLHAPPADSPPAYLDLYGTLAEKTWRAEAGAARLELRTARNAMLAASVSDDVARRLPRKCGLSPATWTIGHVAHTYDLLVRDPLRLPKSEAAHESWRWYDSSLVDCDDRWTLDRTGELPYAASARAHLDECHAACEGIIADAEAREGGLLGPVESYLLRYGATHECWHAEDLIHSR